MLIIRYRRIGKRNHAQFKIVVAEKSFPVKGRFVEALGSYDPHSKETVLKEDRIKHWLETGAQCSDSVYNLLVSNGIIKGEKRKVSIKEKEAEEGAEEASTEGEEKVEEKKEEDASDSEEKPTKEEKPAEKESQEKPEESKEEKKEETK